MRGDILNSDEKKSLAEELLRQKYTELGRIPHKDDFDEKTRSRIKAYLGPWPRALEAAGLKPVRPKTSAAKRKKAGSKRKRIPAEKKRLAGESTDLPDCPENKPDGDPHKKSNS